RITPVLDQIARQAPFTPWNEDSRNPDRRPKRKHYRFPYTSLDPNNPEPFVLLDVVVEHVPHPFTEQKSVAVPFVETDDPPLVTVPTLNGLVGDKLTAFAPETVGVRYRPDLSQQIIKQMFDVGELFVEATDLSQISQAHEASFKAENGFRHNRFTLNQALDDSLNTAFRISQLNLAHEEHWDGKKRGILLKGISAINATLVRETYTVEDARISASRAGLLAALLRHGRSGRLAPFRFVLERAGELPPGLEGRYAVLNPLREIATEAFHNWHQVQLLEQEVAL
ncbi:MAG: nucleotidyl transferase AbiEii/AbiGii toxin family protein, partial [Phycisphaerae bacterium]|nr:nucleotidyl transferase AbiEii/AbiGii toxin family protein [Phycisphaerae bacterium]